MNLWSRILDIFFPVSSLEPTFERAVMQRGALRAPRQHKLSWILSIYDYREPIIRSVVRTLKNRRNTRLARMIAYIMYEHLIVLLADQRLFANMTQPIVIPIPLSPRRMRSRGFNQATLIGTYIARYGDWKLNTTTLVRVIDGPKQALIKNRSLRMKNIVGCFSIKNTHRIRHQHVILVDDVTTTGATLYEARRLLLAAGASSVIAITIAH